MYVEIPMLDRWNRRYYKEYLPLMGGLYFSWSKHDFEICEQKSFFPKGRKDGKHIFTISIGIFYWSVRFIVYLPKNL
jgi:hypothetical protein